VPAGYAWAVPRVLILARRRRWPQDPETPPLTREAWETRYGDAIEGFDEGFDDGAGAFAAVVDVAEAAASGRLLGDYPYVAWIDPVVRLLPPLDAALRARWRVLRGEHLAVRDAMHARWGGPERPDPAEEVRRWEALLAAAEGLDPTHPAAADLLGTLAHAYGEAGRYDEREQARRRVLALHAGWLAPTRTGRPRDPRRVDDPVLVHDWLVLAGDTEDAGWRLGDRRRTRQATAYFRRALALAERTLPPEHPRVRACVFGLAQHWQSRHRYAAAEPLLHRLIRLDERLLAVQTGREHPVDSVTPLVLAGDLGRLADLFVRQRRYAEAEPLLRRRLAVHEQDPTLTAGGRSLRALAMAQLAEVVARQGRLAEAAALYGTAADAMRTTGRRPPRPAPEHAMGLAVADALDAALRADTLRQQGNALRRLGDLVGAERAYDRALTVLASGWPLTPDGLPAGPPGLARRHDLVRAEILSTVAALLRATGGRRPAAALSQQVRELRTRVLTSSSQLAVQTAEVQAER
jgi:tetratricopeptide (TPR) repeat protein